MIRTLKHRLAHIQPNTLRYKMAHRVVKEEKLRRAHACTLYWVYLPTAILGFVVIPLLRFVFFLVAQPVAWMAGYRKIGKFLPVGNADENVELAKESIYENAHLRIAPWRVVLPAAIVSVLVFLGFTAVRTAELIVLAIVVVGLAVGWFLYHRWGRVTEVWERICPRLEVDG